MKITEKTTNGYPRKLDFDAPAYTGAQFSLLDLYLTRSRKRYPKALEMETQMILSARKTVEDGYRMHVEIYH